jgi:hypothetical protein
MKKHILHFLLLLAYPLFALSITPEEREKALSQVSAGNVSTKNATLVKDIFKKYGNDISEMYIVQPSKFAMEVNPLNELVSYNLTYNILYVNQPAFNKLPLDEREAVLTGWAIWLKEYPHSVRMGWIVIILFLVIEIALAIGLYFLLGHKTNLGRRWRIIIAVCFYFIMDLSDEIWKRTYYQPSLRFAQDRRIAEVMGSKKPFLNYLKRQKKEIQKKQHTTNAQFWLAAEPMLDKRIQHLEQL